MTVRDILLRLLSVFLLIAINAFFVTAEFSIVSVRRSRISQLVEAGDIQAQTVQSLQRSIERLLSTTQLGITLSSLALGWIGEDTMGVMITNAITYLPIPNHIHSAIAHSVSIPIAFLLIAYLQIVLGELCPKSVALLYPEQLARFFAPPSLAIASIFNPFIWTLNQSTRFLLRILGIQYTGQGWHNRVTPEELQLIITTERESTGLEAEERQLLNNVFEFGDVLAEQVMIPRTSIASIPYNATLNDLLIEITESQHSCYPITGESLDDIRGIINLKDLALPLTQGLLTQDTSIQPWVKPVRFIPESTPLSELLPLMQRSQQSMIMIVDEFGGTAGLVTIQDLIAEIIGDQPENTLPEQISLQIINEQTFIVQAQINLEEINEILALSLPLTDEYQTLGGFLLYEFQKIPAQGEILSYNNLEFTILSTDGPRLERIQIYRHEITTEYSPNSENEQYIVTDNPTYSLEQTIASDLDIDLELNSENPKNLQN